MKVLYLALGRDLAQADAGTTHTMNIVNALAGLGVEVTLAARGGPEHAGAAGFVAAALPKRLGSVPVRQMPRDLVDAARGVDLIQERVEESGGAGVRLAKALHKPLVLEINTPISGYPNPILRRVANLNLRRQARAARAIITQTPISRNIIEGYTQARVFVVPNGADPETFSPAVEATSVPGAARRTVIAFAGSLRPWHGVEDLIAASARVLKARRDAFLLVLGGGRRRADLEEAAAGALGRSNCRFTGAVAPAEVPGYLARADVLAAPFSPARDRVRRKQFERFGMWWSPVKIFEYMAMGKPIVASHAGLIPEYLAGAGVTFPPGDAQALADAILGVLGSPQAAAKLGAAARQRLVANYTWKKAADLTVAVWREVLEGRQKVSLTR